MAPVLWVIAVISTLTVIHRIRNTYEQLQPLDERSTAEQKRALETQTVSR
jgi:hypothetical protein